jgi:hypothetical protein
MRGGALVLSILALSACVEGGCPSAAARDLRTVDRLISETETNIQRGYAIGTQRSGGFNFCVGGGGDNLGVAFCGEPGRRPVAIDRAAEQRKLDGLLARRADLARQVAADRQACSGGVAS